MLFCTFKSCFQGSLRTDSAELDKFHPPEHVKFRFSTVDYIQIVLQIIIYQKVQIYRCICVRVRVSVVLNEEYGYNQLLSPSRCRKIWLNETKKVTLLQKGGKLEISPYNNWSGQKTSIWLAHTICRGLYLWVNCYRLMRIPSIIVVQQKTLTTRH